MGERENKKQAIEVLSKVNELGKNVKIFVWYCCWCVLL